MDFQNFKKFNDDRILMETIFEISIIHKPSLGSLDVPQKFGPDRFSRFDVYWIQTDRQTDKQTNRQAKFIYR